MVIYNKEWGLPATVFINYSSSIESLLYYVRYKRMGEKKITKKEMKKLWLLRQNYNHASLNILSNPFLSDAFKP